MRDNSQRIMRGTLCGHPEREGIADEWWRPAVGGAVQVDGRSAPGQVVGGERLQRESKAASNGEIWGSDRS